MQLEKRSLWSKVSLTLLGVVGALALVSGGCGDELEPTNPTDAYLMFRNALFQGDAETVWRRTDEQTHKYFQERYKQLVEMDSMIRRYLPQTDHKIARKQSGTVLLDDVDNGKELFMHVFDGESVPADEAIEVGSRVDETRVGEKEKFARVITRAGQEYVLERDPETEEWHVMLVKSSDAVDKSFGWLDFNQNALQKTVEELIAEEREEREKVIAELMGYDDDEKK